MRKQKAPATFWTDNFADIMQLTPPGICPVFVSLEPYKWMKLKSGGHALGYRYLDMCLGTCWGLSAKGCSCTNNWVFFGVPVINA